jgi:hypothetical protein
MKIKGILKDAFPQQGTADYSGYGVINLDGCFDVNQ